MSTTATTEKRLLARSLCAALCAATLLCASSAAEAEYPTRQRVERALAAIEKGPSKASLLRVFGPDVEGVLREIVAKPSRAVLARVRALTALRYFPSKGTRALLAKEIAANKGKRRGLALLYLRQALTSYAVVAGKQALSTVTPLLSHPSLDVRVDAGEALRLSGAPQARALIAARVKSDPSATVRAELTRQLQLIDRAADKRAK